MCRATRAAEATIRVERIDLRSEVLGGNRGPLEQRAIGARAVRQVRPRGPFEAFVLWLSLLALGQESCRWGCSKNLLAVASLDVAH